MALASAPAYPGEWTLLTRYTAYVLRDGTCVEVRARRGGTVAPDDARLGTVLAAWLSPEGAVQKAWAPGCYAVLRRADDEGGSVTYAVTSTTRSLVCGRAPNVRVRPVDPPRPSQTGVAAKAGLR